MKKRIAILGSTGSIGRQTLEVIDRFPDKFEVTALAAGTNVDEIIRQAQKYKPKLVSIGQPENVSRIRSSVPEGTTVSFGIEGMVEAAVLEEVDVVVTSV
ncbi:MAG TPA: 1-deoxy-D-xylulose-5-phosphate reductoisomerase, partial [Desulfobacteria bacterium]|nr:1-deoxy-D-xylulose-5-phosphate reductoisomerase [Desulfobacteria bacterium]